MRIIFVALCLLLFSCNQHSDETEQLRDKIDSTSLVLECQINMGKFYLQYAKEEDNENYMQLADSLRKEALKTWKVEESLYHELKKYEIYSDLDSSNSDSSFGYLPFPTVVP